MGSISAFVASPRIEFRSALNPQFCTLLKNYGLFPVQFQIPKCVVSQSLFYSFRKYFHSTASILPFSKLSNSRCSSPSQSNLSNFFLETLVGLLVGSFILMGYFNVKGAIALSPQISRGNSTLSEENDTQKEESEMEMSEKILKHDPRNIDTLKAVLYGKMKNGKTKEAIKFVQRLIDLEPDEVEWRLLFAFCHETLGQLDKAKRLFMEILQERPLLVRALHGLALVMIKNDEGESVFELLDLALDIACREKKITEQRSIRILIAQMHVIKGELDEGLKKLQDLVDENPRDFRPYLCQGIIYSLQDKKEEAAKQFETYQALVPDEFPQKEFIDDVVLEAKSASSERFQKELDAEFSYR